VIVIGAGIVRHRHRPRASSRAGHAVTLVDTATSPGKATSYGNAGFIAIDHVLATCPAVDAEAACRKCWMDRQTARSRCIRPSIPYLPALDGAFLRSARLQHPPKSGKGARPPSGPA